MFAAISYVIYKYVKQHSAQPMSLVSVLKPLQQNFKPLRTMQMHLKTALRRMNVHARALSRHSLQPAGSFNLVILTRIEKISCGEL